MMQTIVVLTMIAGSSAQLPYAAAPQPYGGACSINDQSMIKSVADAGEDAGLLDEESFPQIVSDCVPMATTEEGINQNVFNQCLTQQVPISWGCSTCFAEEAQYGFQNCRVPCEEGSDSYECQACAASFPFAECTGIEEPEPIDEDELPAQTDYFSIPVAALMGLVAGSGITFAVHRFRRSTLTPSGEDYHLAA